MFLNLTKVDNNKLIIIAQRFIMADGPPSGPTQVTFMGSTPTEVLLFDVKETPEQILDVVKSMVGGCGQGRPQAPTPGGMPIQGTAPRPQFKQELPPTAQTAPITNIKRDIK